MLLTLSEIQDLLDAEFRPVEPLLSGLRLISGGYSLDAILESESRLGRTFPHDFRRALSRFKLGPLTVGPTSFGRTDDYLREIEEHNLFPDIPWWGNGERPTDLILIGNSDSYGILLQLESGFVRAVSHGNLPEQSVSVAANFELFFRGIGTVFSERQRTADRRVLATQVARRVGCAGSASFWRHLAD